MITSSPINNNPPHPVLTLPALALALKPALAPKQFGSGGILAVLVAEAALAVMPAGEKVFGVDNIRCVVSFFFPSFFWCVGEEVRMKVNSFCFVYVGSSRLWEVV